MTVADLVYSAFRIAGILSEAGRGYNTAEGADGLKVLNSMIDAWKAERLMVYAILRTVFDITASKQTYTIGQSGADWNLERPERIENAGFLWTNSTPNLETPLKVFTPQEWAATTPKGLTSQICSGIYYEPFVPNGKINTWPIQTANWKIALYTWQTVNQFASLDDSVTLPPAYQEAVEYNLALRLAARFPNWQKLSPVSIELARTALAKVKAINTPQLLMQTEAAARGTGDNRGHWNPFTNSYVS